MIKPIIPDAQIRNYNGRFRVQLEIPEGSTLSQRDIERAGALASWDIDPNTGLESFEGGRSIIISREYETERRGLSLKALQISGIGYKPIDFTGEVSTIEKNSKIIPPSTKNLMSMLPGTLMTTCQGVNGKPLNTKPTYRALGTYTAEELETKVKKTLEASLFEINGLVTPVVEAYGRYLSPELQNSEGNFGFIVFSVPKITSERAAETVHSKIGDFLENNPRVQIREAIATFYDLSLDYTLPLIRGLKNLHDIARAAHLQPHKSNYYLVNGVPYLMDWSTLARLETNSMDNIINRAIDLNKPRFNFDAELKNLFGRTLPQDALEYIGISLAREVLEAYSGETAPSMLDLVTYYSEKLGNQAREFDLTIEWLKDQGYEGFPKKRIPRSQNQRQILTPSNLRTGRLVRTNELSISPFYVNPERMGIPLTSTNKVGRNSPCPCNSGKKFKNCCLRK